MHNSSELESEAYIQEIRKVLKMPDSEDQRFRNAQFLREADRWLSNYIASQQHREQTILLHVRVMRALRDWGRVIERVRKEGWKKKKVRARALVEAATAYVHLQEFMSAERCLREALKLDPNLAARTEKARKGLQGQLRLDLYGRLSAFVYSAIRSGQGSTAEHLYTSALHVYGLPGKVAKEAVNVIAGFGPESGERSGHELRLAASANGSCKLIITCGSGYSGTGAVTAYLREFKCLPMPFGMREIAVLKKSYGLCSLLSKWQEWTPEARMQALQKMVLQSILGIPCYEDSSDVDRMYSRSVTLNSLFLGEELEEKHAKALSAYSAAFVGQAKNAVTSDKLREASADFLNGILRIKGGEIALLNNCVHQTQIELCGLLNNSRIIVIVRDPRDQYVAHQTETPRKRITVEEFIRKRKRADAAVMAYLASGRNNVKSFGFEAFVTESLAREEVREWAGLSDFSVDPNARFFFPEKSERNVGIYKKWGDNAEIELIERELTDQLVGS